MTLLQLLDAWNSFFHAEVSCATLVIFRIAIGCLLLFVFPEDAEWFLVHIGGWSGRCLAVAGTALRLVRPTSTV